MTWFACDEANVQHVKATWQPWSKTIRAIYQSSPTHINSYILYVFWRVAKAVKTKRQPCSSLPRDDDEVCLTKGMKIKTARIQIFGSAPPLTQWSSLEADLGTVWRTVFGEGCKNGRRNIVTHTHTIRGWTSKEATWVGEIMIMGNIFQDTWNCTWHSQHW